MSQDTLLSNMFANMGVVENSGYTDIGSTSEPQLGEITGVGLYVPRADDAQFCAGTWAGYHDC